MPEFPWPRIVAPERVLSICQIEINYALILKGIV